MQFVVLLIAGWAQSLSLAWPFSFQIESLGVVQGQALWWLQILAMAVFAHSLYSATSHKQAAKHVAWRSWVFSTAWLCGSIWWLYISMHTYGGLAPWLAAFAVLLLAGCMALFYMLFLSIFQAVAGVNKQYFAIIFASSWMLAEMARGTWLTGFPWGAVGYSHLDGPLAGLAAYLGVYGMSFVSAFLAMALAQLAGSMLNGQKIPRNPQQIQGLIVIPLLILVAALVSKAEPWSDQQPSAKPLDVTLLQGNIPQNEKFQAGSGIVTALAWYSEQLQASKASLTITPETAIPLLPSQLPPTYWAQLVKPFLNGNQAALIGLPLGNTAQGYSNAVQGFKPNTTGVTALVAPYQYNKNHLVPFGEFIPPFAKWFIDLMKIPLGTFNRGGVDQPSFIWQGQRLGLNICYEDLFGEELAQRFANLATAPTILVNVSNIAWFGNTIAIDQHLNIARLRSMELARPSIRATNTGATAIIDATGKVTQSLERHTRGALVGTVQGNTAITPFAWWTSRFWLWPLWMLGAFVLLFGFKQHIRHTA